ncbi:hypothetical protein FAF44_05185 [Nonomuraea sp. MG754425]|uniref:hypothetical protein n=1 Tax=Nonomuraea sp. MG754425 TaxID=2570319 RepID=UPI001F47C011|nr:hypothetical protein [Nonomuraea sp. MG754425]MCF6467805.1 hypothetical protein [Nonomuraea sp. MG754425]
MILAIPADGQDGTPQPEGVEEEERQRAHQSLGVGRLDAAGVTPAMIFLARSRRGTPRSPAANAMTAPSPGVPSLDAVETRILTCFPRRPLANAANGLKGDLKG